jgi:hypothetical protein
MPSPCTSHQISLPERHLVLEADVSGISWPELFEVNWSQNKTRNSWHDTISLLIHLEFLGSTIVST